MRKKVPIKNVPYMLNYYFLLYIEVVTDLYKNRCGWLWFYYFNWGILQTNGKYKFHIQYTIIICVAHTSVLFSPPSPVPAPKKKWNLHSTLITVSNWKVDKNVCLVSLRTDGCVEAFSHRKLIRLHSYPNFVLFNRKNIPFTNEWIES